MAIKNKYSAFAKLDYPGVPKKPGIDYSKFAALEYPPAPKADKPGIDYSAWANIALNDQKIANTDVKQSARPEGWAAWENLGGVVGMGSDGGTNNTAIPGASQKTTITGKPIKKAITAQDYSAWEKLASAFPAPTNTLQEVSAKVENATLGKMKTPNNIKDPSYFAKWEQLENIIPDSNASTNATVPPQAQGATGDGKSYADWAKLDYDTQNAYREAETEYAKARARYGAEAEALAQRGLTGSGYAQWADLQAYATMQGQKQNIRDKSYAKWAELEDALNGKNDLQSEQNAQNIANLVSSMASDGITEENAASYRLTAKSQGYTDAQFDEAYKQYTGIQTQQKAEQTKTAQKAVSDYLGGNNQSVQDLVTALGGTYTGADDASEYVGAIEQAYKAGTIDEATRSNLYKYVAESDVQNIVGKTIFDVANDSIKAMGTADNYKSSLTESDYNETIEAAYKALGNTAVIADKKGKKYGEVVFDVSINGQNRIYTADWSGEGRASKTTESGLNTEFGDAILAFYKDKVWYQYDDGKWTQIEVKVASRGSKDEGAKVLQAIAYYYGKTKSQNYYRDVNSEGFYTAGKSAGGDASSYTLFQEYVKKKREGN